MRSNPSVSKRHLSLIAVGVVAALSFVAACSPEPSPPKSTTTTTQPSGDPTPAIVVSNTSGLASNGSATVTVTGTGFDPAVVDGAAGSPVGVYVAIGVGASATYPEAYTSAKYIRPTGPDPETSGGAKIKADGTFSATITVNPVFAAQGRAVNCYVEQCSIYVFSAHTGTYAPWTFTKTAATFAAPTSPMMAVSKTTNLDAAGETVTVTGAGYSQTAPGIYVVFGPVDTAAQWWLDASLFGDAKWLNNTALGANGTFTTTLNVVGSYDANGTVDCAAAAGACSVATMKAHGTPDRTQDVVVPLTFSQQAAA